MEKKKKLSSMLDEHKGTGAASSMPSQIKRPVAACLHAKVAVSCRSSESRSTRADVLDAAASGRRYPAARAGEVIRAVNICQNSKRQHTSLHTGESCVQVGSTGSAHLTKRTMHAGRTFPFTTWDRLWIY